MPIARIAAINLECTTPDTLIRFWADLLGGEIVIQTPEFCAVKVGETILGVARVEDYQPPTWPSSERSQQVHFDLAVDDLDAAEREAMSLGASKEDWQPDPERARVLRDPAGHPFCLRS